VKIYGEAPEPDKHYSPAVLRRIATARPEILQHQRVYFLFFPRGLRRESKLSERTKPAPPWRANCRLKNTVRVHYG
jgi:hypothetical protein